MTIEAVSLRITSVYLVVLSTQNRHPMTTTPVKSVYVQYLTSLSQYLADVSSLCFFGPYKRPLIMLIWPSLPLTEDA